jgi:GTP-binding protein
MSLPTVAVIGRPNVGKSTLVNRILGRREAIVEQRPGVTRDRKVVDGEWNGRRFTLVDTGGWLAASPGSLDAKVSAQSERAMADADVALFVVDVTTGLTEEDARAASLVRRMRGKAPTLVVVNKVDSDSRESDIWDFTRLGIGEPWPISALHGRGTGDLLDHVVKLFPAPSADEAAALSDDDGSVDEQAFTTDVDADEFGSAAADEDPDERVPAVAIAGRPNVGKSTLFNRLIGDERSVVHDLPGTTRDTIDTVVDTAAGRIRFVDTAGMRRKSRIDDGTEYYSFVRALRAIDHADIALLVIDATEGVTSQDQRLAERIDAAGSPVVIVLNKWELLDADHRALLVAEVEDRLGFLRYAPTLKVSARTGLGVHKLIPALDNAIEAYHRRVPTRELNKVLQLAQAEHPVPNARILYATQGATDPPTFTLFTNRPLPQHYLRYLERKIREHFEFGPTPLKLRVRRRAG